MAVVGVVRFRKNVSSASKNASPKTGTASVFTCARDSPGWKVSVPLTAS